LREIFIEVPPSCAHPRIEHGVERRRDDLNADEERGRRDDRAFENGKIARGVRLEDQRSQTGTLEQPLEDDGPAEECAELRRDHGEMATSGMRGPRSIDFERDGNGRQPLGGGT
jgi:hypothetical protein